LGARPEVMASSSPGDPASPFGGNPLACAAATETLRTMKRMRMPQRVEKTGRYFMARLTELAERHPQITDVRGMGLLIGAELQSADLAKKVQIEVMKRGILINVTAERVLRFVPPLIIGRTHIDRLIDALDVALREVAG